MPTLEPPVVLTPEELESLLQGEGVIVADLSNAAAYAQRHLPGAVHVDSAQITASQPPVMGLLPPAKQLGQVLSAAGITPESHVVAYDAENGQKACRFLWTLEVAGHRRFSLLDGGLQAWVDGQHPTESQPSSPSASTYPVSYGEPHCANKAYILAHLNDDSVVILDARTAAEYNGVDKRALRGGHIPGAMNIDWSQAIVGGGDMRLRPAEELRALYADAGVTPDKEIIVHCQSHQRSSHTYIVLRSLGYEKVRGYPGSWSDWGNDPDTPVE